MRAFDRWVSRSPYSAQDLSLFRVLYSSLAILTLPRIEFVSLYPTSLFNPPPGPFEWMSAPPSLGETIALEIITVMSLCALMVGLATPWASGLAGVCLLLCGGVSFSFGKIDHTILLAIVPLILGWSGWGARFSVDSLIHKGPLADVLRAAWPLRFLALCVGVAFATSGIQKVLGGWLSPYGQSAEWHMLRKLHFDHNAGPLAPAMSAVTLWPIWEVVDWLTVLLELAVIVTVVSWRAFRVTIAIATLFHLAIALILGISFTSNVIVYGAFVSWAWVLTSATARSSRRIHWPLGRSWTVAIGCALVPLVTLLWSYGRVPLENAQDAIGLAIVLAGAGGGSIFLLIAGRATFHRASQVAPESPEEP